MEHECLVIKDGILKGFKKGVNKAGIKEIKIPEGVTKIGEYAFSNCVSLESVEIPASVTRIDICAFNNCKSFKNVEIPEGVKYIEWFAFADCASLASLEIPTSVTSIELLPFDGCESLARVRYSGTLAQWCVMDGGGWLTSVAKSIILTGENGLDLKTLTTLKIPEDITSIGGWAFENCERLESVEIPAGVTSIGQSAFDGCEHLERAKYGGTLAQWCAMNGGGHLAGVAKSMILAGENGLDLKKITALKIPEGVTEIGYHAFCGCKNFESMDISASVTRINDFAFFECEGLKSVDIPKNVTSIGFHAFHGCRALESVAISEGLANIDASAFYGCESLKNVEIPASVTSIGTFAFVDCSLGSAKYGGTLAQWCAMEGGGWFMHFAKSVTLAGEGGMDLKKQTALKIPEGVTSIGEYAFYGCESLASVKIPANVTSIGEEAFKSCDSLESASYGGTLAQWCAMEGGGDITDAAKSVVLAGEGGMDLKKQTTLKIPEGVTKIGTAAFCRCDNLESVEIPEGVENIGFYAFRECKALESVSIPASVTSIEGCAFFGCERLKDVNYAGTKEQWKKIETGHCGTGKATVHCADGDIAAE